MLASDAAVVARRPAGQRRHPADVIEADLLAQVAADDVQLLPMPFGYAVDFGLSRMRVESTQLAPTITTLPSTSCSAPVLRSMLDAARLALVVDQDACDDRVRPDLELAGLQRERDQVIGGAEERRRVAAGAAPAAVVAGREAARRPGHVGAAAGDDVDAQRLRAFLQQPLGAAGRRRLQELAARQRLGVVVAAADADHLLDLVVVRRDVGVGDRPGISQPSLAAALKSISDRRRLTRPHTLVLPPRPHTRASGRSACPRAPCRAAPSCPGRTIAAPRPWPGARAPPTGGRASRTCRVRTCRRRPASAPGRPSASGSTRPPAGRAAADDDDGVDLRLLMTCMASAASLSCSAR